MAIECQQRCTFQEVDINRKRAITQMPKSIRGEQEVEEDLALAYDFLETENKDMKVPEYLPATTS